MDTHTIFFNLRKSGFTIDHSEAILGAIKESGQQCDFATRSDLKELRQELRFEMTHLEHRLINKIGAIVIGTASVMMFLNNFFDSLN
jgi:hypothetical protein